MQFPESWLRTFVDPKLSTDEPIRWKLLAREVEKPPQEGSIPIDRLNASNDD